MYFGEFYLPEKVRPHVQRAVLRESIKTGATWRRLRQIDGYRRRVVALARKTDTALCAGFDQGPTYDEFLTFVAMPVSNHTDGHYKFGLLSVRRIGAVFGRYFPNGRSIDGFHECAGIHLEKPPQGQAFFTRAQALSRLLISEIHPCRNYGTGNDGTDPQHTECKLVGFSDAILHTRNTSTHWSQCSAEVFQTAPLFMPLPQLPISGWFPSGEGSRAQEPHHH